VVEVVVEVAVAVAVAVALVLVVVVVVAATQLRKQYMLGDVNISDRQSSFYYGSPFLRRVLNISGQELKYFSLKMEEATCVKFYQTTRCLTPDR
jgi:hypothetical protein